MELSLNPDKSVSSEFEDAFQRYSFAKRITNLVVSNGNPESLVIGIYGRWGEGKTSVLNFITSELRSGQENVIVHFNPWLFSSESQLLIGFFHQFATGLNKSFKGNTEKIGEFLKTYASGIGTITSLATGFDSKEILEAIGTRLAEKSLDHYKTKINRLILESKKRIIVFIDDIDRLTVEEVQIVFKIVKLAANFTNTTYILAFDNDYVATALAKKYPKGGHDFLEKIIQLPLMLPKAQPAALRKFTLDKIQEVLTNYSIQLDQTEINRFNEVFDRSLLSKIQNPRIATRYSNSISFAIPLLEGEANVTDIILIEGVKAIFPTTYSFIRENYHLLTTHYSSSSLGLNEFRISKEEAKKVIDEFIDQCENGSQDSIRSLLLDLFPQLNTLFQNIVYSERNWRDWYLSMRICSPYHFNRYFTYTVLSGDISDTKFQEQYLRLTKSDLINQGEKPFEVLKSFDPEKLILKLQLHEEVLSNDESRQLALNLCLISDHFPNPRVIFSFTTPFYQLISILVRIISKQQSRIELAIKLVSRAKSITLILAIRRKLYPQIDIQEDEWIISKSDFDSLSKNCLSKIFEYLSLQEVIDTLQESEQYDIMIMCIQFEQKKLKDFTKNFLKEGQTAFIKLLHIFSQTSFSTGHPSPYKSGFSKENYLRLVATTDIKRFYNYSVKYFGEPKALENIDITVSMYEPLSDLQLVRIFQKVHLLKTDAFRESSTS